MRVPPGFQNILECFAREVLRLQPMDIYKFGMDYFDLLLRKRRETGEMDVAKLGAAFEDRYYNSRSFMVRNLAVSSFLEFPSNIYDQGVWDKYNWSTFKQMLFIFYMRGIRK
ncbi:unnamed protein product [Schistocephalus solidus]|uniref:RIIa domain-containing protein n=1 Tax=Schistocephalus solidus TaxID=70667 RepID=A0A3P7F286_SCHSO|nr:unnamed protein product [Schistocephalus solidus]